jgi:D-glycero-alpha-D-manno-heptose 1-phosphate guanylyltransferase
MFNVDLTAMFAFHRANKAATTLALKKMTDFDRYGVVHTNDKGIITAFDEKKPTAEGTINGGVYIINREAFLEKDLSEKFSFEKDYLEKFVTDKAFYGCEDKGYFIDIGIPEDYSKAQEDFKTMFP